MSKQPTYLVYQVRENADSGKGYWTRLGAAWRHQDGKGFNLVLDAMPLDGRLTLREPDQNGQEA